MRLHFFLEVFNLYHKTLPISSTLLKTRKSPTMGLASLDVSFLHTNIPQTEEIEVICRHY